MKTEYIETYLPLFDGFYNTAEGAIIEEEYENEVARMIESGELTEEQAKKSLWHEVNWREFERVFAQTAVDVVNARIHRATGISDCCIFEGVWSPQFYNYSNDEIRIKVSRENFEKLKLAWCLPDEESEAKLCASLIEESFKNDDLHGIPSETFIWDIQDKFGGDGRLSDVIYCEIERVIEKEKSKQE